ncbi:MAG: hypothetical protein IKW87_00545 [Ruminococcus sp.]|nr:hypothetical protein [Ruminococcus sp.]
MKKTDKTALTAAAFAAALNIVPMGSSAYDPSEEPIQDVYGPPVYFETTTVEEMVPQPDYGPMPAWTTETTAVTQDPVITTTEMEAQPTYGPEFFCGDITHDNVVDTFDLIAMRQLFTKNKLGKIPYSPEADLNYDGKVSLADLVTLNKFMLGNKEYFTKETGVPTTTTEKTWYQPDPVTTTTEMEFVAVYGPPAWFEESTETTTVPDEIDEPDVTTTTEAQLDPLYGPPSWFGKEDK